jgi:hypothetical protein
MGDDENILQNRGIWVWVVIIVVERSGRTFGGNWTLAGCFHFYRCACNPLSARFFNCLIYVPLVCLFLKYTFYACGLNRIIVYIVFYWQLPLNRYPVKICLSFQNYSNPWNSMKILYGRQLFSKGAWIKIIQCQYYICLSDLTEKNNSKMLSLWFVHAYANQWGWK